MRTKNPTDFDQYLAESAENRRGVRQEQLILHITETLVDAMDRKGIKKADLARALGVTPAFISQVLSGGRNLTLRTVSDLSAALGGEMKVWFRFHDYAPFVEREADGNVIRWRTHTWGSGSAALGSEVLGECIECSA